MTDRELVRERTRTILLSHRVKQLGGRAAYDKGKAILQRRFTDREDYWHALKYLWEWCYGSSQ